MKTLELFVPCRCWEQYGLEARVDLLWRLENEIRTWSETQAVQDERIYPDPECDGIDCEPDEWHLAGGTRVHHVPSFTVWYIGCREEARDSGKASLFNFYAELSHVCDGRYEADQGLDPDALNYLGRGAIAFFLQAIGSWKPNVVEHPDTPEQRRIKANFPKARQ